MNLFLRFFWLLLHRAVRSVSMGPFDSCVTRFRTSIFDLDLNFHMNNGRYFSIMDLGRFDLMLKSKVFWKLIRKGYYPVVVSESIRFRRSLRLFESFTLKTKIEGWNDKDVFMAQQFYTKQSLAAGAFVRVRFKKRGIKGPVPIQDVFKELGLDYETRSLAKKLEAQLSLDDFLLLDK